MSRSRIENKNVIFEKLFSYTAPFFGAFGPDFFAKSLRSKSAKIYRVLAVFFFSKNSHEKKEHAVEHAIFSSRHYAGLIHFARKIPIHFVRTASGGKNMQKTYGFCSFWVEWAKTIGFLHIQFQSCKNHMFFAFLCHRTQPIQPQVAQPGAKNSGQSQRIFDTEHTPSLSDLGHRKKRVLPYEKNQSKNGSAKLIYSTLFWYFDRFFPITIFYTAPVKKFLILL